MDSAILDTIDAAQPFVDEPDPAPAPKAKAPRRRSPEKAKGEQLAPEVAALRPFGLARLEDELARVKVAPVHGRSAAIAAAAEALGAIAAAGVLDERFAKAALERVAAELGLFRDEGAKPGRKLIADAFRRGSSRPQDLEEIRQAVANRAERRPSSGDRMSDPFPGDVAPSSSAPSPSPAPPAAAGENATSQTGASASASAAARGGGARKPPRATEDDEARNLRLAFFPLTDLGNAERMRERYQSKLIWCKELGWMAWDDRRWAAASGGVLVKVAEHDTVRAIQDEAEAVRDSGIRGETKGGRDYVVDVKRDGTTVYFSDKIAAWGRASESASRLGAVSNRAEPYFAVPFAQLDADKMKINVRNGTLVVHRRRGDLDCIEFRDHDPDDLITKIAPVDYDPDATCPEYDRFLARVQPSETMRRFLNQWGGLSLTGDVTEQKLVFFYGKGGNGKSVLTDTWGFVAGDYGETVPIETFLDTGRARSGGQASPDLALLPGVRMLRTSEPEKNSKLAEALIKLVTGGEAIQARDLNKSFFRFYPEFKLTMSGNYRPTLSGTDEGIRRRIKLVPFDVSIPKEERDPHLLEKLRAEASGILNRLLDGLRDWCEHGLIEPEEVASATADYFSDSDPCGRFLAMCVEACPGSDVPATGAGSMLELHTAWATAAGEKEWTSKGLSNALVERGFRKHKSGSMWWIGVKLIKSPSDFVGLDGKPRGYSVDKNAASNSLMGADEEI